MFEESLEEYNKRVDDCFNDLERLYFKYGSSVLELCFKFYLFKKRHVYPRRNEESE